MYRVDDGRTFGSKKNPMKYLAIFLVCFTYMARVTHRILEQDKFYTQNRHSASASHEQ